MSVCGGFTCSADPARPCPRSDCSILSLLGPTCLKVEIRCVWTWAEWLLCVGLGFPQGPLGPLPVSEGPGRNRLSLCSGSGWVSQDMGL